MTEQIKKMAHWRAVYKSDHLGVADLEDMLGSNQKLIFTVKQVKQEKDVRVAGKKGDFNIVYFEENIKPWVLNSGNAKIMRGFAGGHENINEGVWGFKVQLYIDPSLTFGGERTGGVKVRPQKPTIIKPEITPENAKMWTNAKTAYKRDGNFSAVLERAIISAENQAAIIKECVDVPVL